MQRHISVDDLARDDFFERVRIEEVIVDPRNANAGAASGFKAGQEDAPDLARTLMHGIFVGEIQALEGAGRTCFDFDTGSGGEEAPFELKLDMARQCWDEARHVEISCKLLDHMGSDPGDFAEQTLLFDAACNPDPVLRLAGVNRALEGLAIDVFNTMRDLAGDSGDPVLFYCEDWMLADEVTHVKMGSDWLRKITKDDPLRRENALEFQREVDKLFSFGGFRGDDDESAVHLARRFREMAGFTEQEITEIAEAASESLTEAHAAHTEAG